QWWVAVFPISMAILVSWGMWPLSQWLRRHGWKDGLAAITVLLIFFAFFAGVVAVIAPSVISQSAEIGQRASVGLAQLQQWSSGLPINLDSASVDDALDQARGWLSDRSGEIASGVFSTAASVGSGLVTTVLVLVLVFFFLKDGERFLPLVRRVCGRRAGQHLTEVLTRVWNTVSGFIRTQAVIGLIDAIPIGVGLLVLGVPLAFTLTVLTFFAAFIPVVGAMVVGGLAVLVALVSNGLTTAIIVLGIVLAVQQIEGNVLQPILQSKSMELHPGVVLLSVAAGGILFGIAGAFLAVPIAASVVVVLRYISEQVDLRTADIAAADLPVATPEGAVAAEQTPTKDPSSADTVDPPSGTRQSDE
ncbi:MAG: AI-2E family transporter, partial [Microbacteriaceae bacterium]